MTGLKFKQFIELETYFHGVAAYVSLYVHVYRFQRLFSRMMRIVKLPRLFVCPPCLLYGHIT